MILSIWSAQFSSSQYVYRVRKPHHHTTIWKTFLPHRNSYPSWPFPFSLSSPSPGTWQPNLSVSTDLPILGISTQMESWLLAALFHWACFGACPCSSAISTVLPFIAWVVVYCSRYWWVCMYWEVSLCWPILSADGHLDLAPFWLLWIMLIWTYVPKVFMWQCFYFLLA